MPISSMFRHGLVDCDGTPYVAKEPVISTPRRVPVPITRVLRRANPTRHQLTISVLMQETVWGRGKDEGVSLTKPRILQTPTKTSGRERRLEGWATLLCSHIQDRQMGTIYRHHLCNSESGNVLH